MATIVQFDIGADIPDGAKNIYEDLFGWKIGTIHRLPDYYEIETAESDGKQGVGGGRRHCMIHSKFYKKMSYEKEESHLPGVDFYYSNYWFYSAV